MPDMQTDCFPNAIPEWPRGPISQLANVNPRYAGEKDRIYPFVEMASVGENFTGIRMIASRKLQGSGLTRFKVGDTLFAKIKPCPENGKVAFISELPDTIGLGSTEFTVLSPRGETNPRFLYHLVCSHPVRGLCVARMEGSTGRQRVPDDLFVNRLIVPIPLPSEQAAIARILDAVDATIKRTGEAAQKAQDLLISVVTELLSCGVGRDAKLRNRGELTDLFAFSKLGRLPRAWRISKVGDEFNVQSGFTLNADRRPRFQKRRYLRVANVKRDFLDLSEIHELEARDDEFALRLLAPDDLVVVEGHADSMEIGRCARVTDEAAGMTFQNHLFRLRTKGELTAGFACMWLNSIYARKFWKARCATSSGLHTVNQRTLRQLALPVPSEREQQEIVSIADRCRQFRDSLFWKRAKLEALKKSLMHDLLTGKVRVGNVSKAFAS